MSTPLSNAGQVSLDPELQLPDVVDHIAVARLYGEPLFSVPQDLYIPPDALEVFLEAFEGPLDLLLYLIRKQNFNILDIPAGQGRLHRAGAALRWRGLQGRFARHRPRPRGLCA